MKWLWCAMLSFSALIPCSSAQGEDAAAPTLPNLTFRSYPGGSVVRLESLRGRPVLITFWASWCGPCRWELPELQQLHAELEDRGFTLLGVNVDGNPPAAVRFLETMKLQMPVYRMEGPEMKAIGVDGLPTNILVDREGRVVHYSTGYSSGLSSVIRELAVEMLGVTDESSADSGPS